MSRKGGNETASGWKCGMAPPLSSLLIYLPRHVYFYGIRVDVLTTAPHPSFFFFFFPGISEYQHGANHSEWLNQTRLVYENTAPPATTLPLPPPFSCPEITAPTQDAVATYGPPAEWV